MLLLNTAIPPSRWKPQRFTPLQKRAAGRYSALHTSRTKWAASRGISRRVP